MPTISQRSERCVQPEGGGGGGGGIFVFAGKGVRAVKGAETVSYLCKGGLQADLKSSQMYYLSWPGLMTPINREAHELYIFQLLNYLTGQSVFTS
jgi:hypothetical protein